MRRVPPNLLPLALLAIALPSALPAQSTWVSIAPPSRVVVGTTQLVVTIHWCDYTGQIDIDTRSVKLNGTDMTGRDHIRWDPPGCGYFGNISDQEFYTSTDTISLTGNTIFDLQANIWDYYYQYLWTADSTYKLPDPRRGVVVTADAQFVTVPPASAQAPRFVVQNTGNATDTDSLSATCAVPAIASGCTVSVRAATLSAGQGTAVTVSYTASGTAGDTGIITLRARRAADATFADSSWTRVTVTANPSPGVVVVGTAPGVGDAVERGLCVTVAVGSGAAAECGDLRLVHALPSVRTLGTVRTPTLLYSSQHARPKPLVLVNVTLPTTGQGGSQVPDSVQGRLMLGSSQRGFASWAGSQWGALGATRRVVVPGDDGSWAQVLDTFKVVVRYYWHTGAPTGDSSAAGHLLVVNRASSPFGAGWWLAGLERLASASGSQVVWIGGDGGARVYTNGGSGIYRAPNVTERDSIVALGAGYVRRAPDSATVYFGSALREDSIKNRLGYVTRFYYGLNGRLDSLKIPTKDSTKALIYRLGYANGAIAYDSAPGGRATTFYADSAATLDSIQDPDNTRVRFTYGTGLNQYRVASRTDRRGKVTAFAWNEAAQRLTQVQRPLAISTTYVFAETRGLPAAVPVDSAYTSITGPRTDVTQVTEFWVNGFGAPVRIRDAVGRETAILYDAMWPGLPASVRTPSGLRSAAWYNGRGLPDSLTAYNPLGNGSNATTRYRWDPVWNQVTSIRSPAGVFDTLAYGAYGNRSFAQHGTDASRRVSFTYDASSHLLVSDTVAGVPRERLYYDTLGNVNRHTTRLGYNTYLTDDAAGRLIFVVTTLDSTRTWYSAVDRVDSTKTWGPAVSAPTRMYPADVVQVGHHYDAEGNEDSTGTRYQVRGQVRGTTQWTYYDDANRVTGQAVACAGTTNYTLDKAGNATDITT